MTLPSFPPSSLPPGSQSAPLSAMAFDFGTQRIGVACGQSISGSARPVSVLKAKDGIPDWDQIGKLIAQWQPDVLVVGLPYNMDGSESDLLQRAIKFANRLNGRFHKPVYGMDERLSSREARDHAFDTQSGNKQMTIDHIAAQIILENWFNELATQAGR